MVGLGARSDRTASGQVLEAARDVSASSGHVFARHPDRCFAVSCFPALLDYRRSEILGCHQFLILVQHVLAECFEIQPKKAIPSSIRVIDCASFNSLLADAKIQIKSVYVRDYLVLRHLLLSA